jgi:hypothetical protein
LDGLAELFITSLLVVVCFPDLLFLVRVACTLLFSRRNMDIPRVKFASGFFQDAVLQKLVSLTGPLSCRASPLTSKKVWR